MLQLQGSGNYSELSSKFSQPELTDLFTKLGNIVGGYSGISPLQSYQDWLGKGSPSTPDLSKQLIPLGQGLPPNLTNMIRASQGQPAATTDQSVQTTTSTAAPDISTQLQTAAPQTGMGAISPVLEKIISEGSTQDNPIFAKLRNLMR